MRHSLFLSLLCFLSFSPFSGETAINVTVDDASGQINFTPRPGFTDDWLTEDSIHAYNSTLTQTSQSGAEITFGFNGTAVFVVGSDWKFTRPFIANIDGKVIATNVTGSNNKFEVECTAYWGYTDLTIGEHLLNIATMDAAEDSLFIVDAIIYTIEQNDDPENVTNTVNSTATLPVEAPSASKSSTTAILGGTVAGVSALSLVLFLSIKFKINIVGNLHLGTWRPFSRQPDRRRFKPLDVEAVKMSSAAMWKEKEQLRLIQSISGDYAAEYEDEGEKEVEEDDDNYDGVNDDLVSEDGTEDGAYDEAQSTDDDPDFTLQTSPSQVAKGDDAYSQQPISGKARPQIARAKAGPKKSDREQAVH